MNIAFKLNIPKELLKALQNPKDFFNSRMSKGINEAAIAVQREIKKNVIPGWGIGHDSGPAGNVFEGRLNRSILAEMVGQLKAIVGANTPYAAIQEYGGDIRPKVAKALFVPLSRRGRKVGPVKGGGSGLVYGEDFIFMQKVTIKPKAYFQRGIETALPGIENIIIATVETITRDMGFV